jgi:tetratricopeptide (TPR) repeat protein
MQTLNHRAALHERVALALERLRAGSRALDAQLAYHYARADPRRAPDVVRYGRAAGEHALELFAYEDAVRELSAALAALDSLTGNHETERAQLLALLGNAHTRAGDFGAARDDFHRAAELSLAAGAWPLLAQAVLGYGGGAGFGGVWVIFAAVDEELVRLLELALAACPLGDSHERVRLLGRLAQALYWGPEKQRALELSEEAVAIARRLGDSTALAYALDSRHVVLWDPDHLDDGRAIAEEMLRLGRSAADRDVQLEALAWLITDALEREPVEIVDGFIAEHARIAEELRQPYHLWYTEAARAMRAHLDGRFEEAAALCEKAYAYGRSSHGENALQTYLQTMFIKLDLGQLDDLIDGLRSYVEASPLAAWHSALALALAGLDRRDEALAQVEWFARRGFRESIRRDCVWMISMAALARTVAHFDDPTHAQELYDLLLPFADRVCVVGGAVLCLGPVSRLLGMLARVAGKPRVALEHFADALERSRALGSPPLIARTQLEAAKAHMARGTADDLVSARRLLDEAAATASEMGMHKVLEDVNALRNPAQPVARP